MSGDERGAPREKRSAAEMEGQGSSPQGDWRGPYGYGHRAHRPDPTASYAFDPGPPRSLPPGEAARDSRTELAQAESPVIWKRPLRVDDTDGSG